MALRATRLSIVEEWKRQICEFSIQSDDAFVSVISKGVDVASTILKDSNSCHIQRSLESLDIELTNYKSVEKSKEPSIRSMMYGFIESVHLSLLQLTEENQSKPSDYVPKQSDQIPAFVPCPMLVPKEEPIDDLQPFPEYTEMSALAFVDDEMAFKEEEILCIESMEDSDREEEPLVKKLRTDSAKEEDKATPQCFLCEKYPSSALGYAEHLNSQHKTTLKSNGFFLICYCGEEVRSNKRNSDHIKQCDGLPFTIHKVNKAIPTTPQCVLCEIYPTTAYGYAKHLIYHKTSLKANGLYLICSCGLEVRSHRRDPKHSKECDGKLFSIHKLEQK